MPVMLKSLPMKLELQFMYHMSLKVGLNSDIKIFNKNVIPTYEIDRKYRLIYTISM